MVAEVLLWNRLPQTRVVDWHYPMLCKNVCTNQRYFVHRFAGAARVGAQGPHQDSLFKAIQQRPGNRPFWDNDHRAGMKPNSTTRQQQPVLGDQSRAQTSGLRLRPGSNFARAGLGFGELVPPKILAEPRKEPEPAASSALAAGHEGMAYDPAEGLGRGAQLGAGGDGGSSHHGGPIAR